MKIAFSLISNRPFQMMRFAGSFSNAMTPGNDYVIALSYEDPIVPPQIQLMLPGNVELRCTKRPTIPQPMNYGQARLGGFDLATDCDYIIMCDDDFVFTPGTRHYNFSSGERYIDAVNYFEQNSSCAAVVMKGFLGGATLGRRIVPMAHGYFETGLGIVFRGKQRPYKDIIAPEFLTNGVGEDVAIFITPIMQGYYCAKARNTPTRKDITKKVRIRDQNAPQVNLNHSPAYNYEWIIQHGVFSKFVEAFGSFDHGGLLPPKLIAMYRENAIKLGHKVVY